MFSYPQTDFSAVASELSYIYVVYTLMTFEYNIIYSDVICTE